MPKTASKLGTSRERSSLDMKTLNVLLDMDVSSTEAGDAHRRGKYTYRRSHSARTCTSLVAAVAVQTVITSWHWSLYPTLRSRLRIVQSPETRRELCHPSVSPSPIETQNTIEADILAACGSTSMHIHKQKNWEGLTEQEGGLPQSQNFFWVQPYLFLCLTTVRIHSPLPSYKSPNIDFHRGHRLVYLASSVWSQTTKRQ